MNHGCGAWMRFSIGLSCLFLALQLGLAQNKPAAGPSASPRTALVDKARALESRGRPDMAVQLWQQVLLSEPNNAEALAGWKSYKYNGPKPGGAIR